MKRARYCQRRSRRSWERDAAIEAKLAKRMALPPPDYPPLHRLEVAVTITVQNHEAGATTVLELRDPRKWDARCDQYALYRDGELVERLSNKTAARNLVGELMPRMMGARRCW